MTSLKKNIIYLFILQGANYIIPLMTFPYLVRVLGPLEYGKLGLATSIIQYFILLVDFGFNLTASKKIAQCDKTKTTISSIYWDTMYAKAILFILGLLISTLALTYFDKIGEIKYVVYILFLQLAGAFLLPVWFFQGLEKVSSVTISYVLARSLSIPLIFILIKKESDIDIAAYIQGGTALFAGLISIYFVYKTKLIRIMKVSTCGVIKSLTDGFSIFVGTVAISLYTLSSPFILGLVSDMHQVGIYVASEKLRQALIGVFLIMGGALYPRVNSLFYKNHLDGFRFVKKLLIYQGGGALIASILFFILCPLISHHILGEQYDDSIIILKFLSPMIFLIVTSVILCNYILLPLGHNKIYAKLPMCMGFIHLIYVIPLSKYYGAKGAAFSILLTEIITFACLVFINIKNGYLQKVLK